MIFEDPPDEESYTTNMFNEEARVLRSNPGKWGVIEDYPKKVEGKADKARGVTYDIKTGKYAVFRPAGAFQAKSRTVINGEGIAVVRVYARYIGEKGQYA